MDGGSISFAYMGDRRSKPTKADLAAATRLRALWDARAKPLGLTQDKMAESMEITQGGVNHYLRGRMPLNYHAVLSFAKALEVEPSEIRKDLPEQAIANPQRIEADWADIAGYAQAVGLGDGAEADEYAAAHKLKFRASSLARKRLRVDKLAVFYGKGDSMLPRIHPGDAILFDTADTAPRDGTLYVIQVPGLANAEFQVKRAMVLDEDVFFAADNPTGDHQWTKPRKQLGKRGENIHVVGRVRWIGSWED